MYCLRKVHRNVRSWPGVGGDPAGHPHTCSGDLFPAPLSSARPASPPQQIFSVTPHRPRSWLIFEILFPWAFYKSDVQGPAQTATQAGGAAALRRPAGRGCSPPRSAGAEAAFGSGRAVWLLSFSPRADSCEPLTPGHGQRPALTGRPRPRCAVARAAPEGPASRSGAGGGPARPPAGRRAESPAARWAPLSRRRGRDGRPVPRLRGATRTAAAGSRPRRVSGGRGRASEGLSLARGRVPRVLPSTRSVCSGSPPSVDGRAQPGDTWPHRGALSHHVRGTPRSRSQPRGTLRTGPAPPPGRRAGRSEPGCCRTTRLRAPAEGRGA